MKLDRVCFMALIFIFFLGACQQGEPTDDDAESEEVADSEKSSDDDEETLPVPVEITLPTRGDIYATYSGTAPIEAFAEADVIAKVDGEVRTLRVEEGDLVTRNQVLAQLDGDRLRLELNESQARLRKLRRDFERNQELQGKGLISEGDFEKIQYDLEALQASYNLASLEVDYTQIRAPIDGVIAERYVKLGNTISAGDAVFRVTGLDPLVAYLHIPEREFRQIEAGQPVQINVDASSGAAVMANVTRVSPIVDPMTGTFKITIEIRDNEGRIKPGMFGRMSIVYDVHENALQVPRSAIIEGITETYVFVVEDGKGIRKTVQTGFSSDGMIEITDGLIDGERVISVGQIGLKNDAAVVVVETAAQ